MKKNLLFFAALAMATVALTACSNKEEGANAANDESVVGATDGLQTDTETSEAIFTESPGQLDETTPTGDVTVEDVTATDDDKSIIDKAKEGYEKAKEAGQNVADKAKEGYDKAKEAGQNVADKAKEGYDKTKEAGKTAIDKTKEGINKAVDKVKNL